MKKLLLFALLFLFYEYSAQDYGLSNGLNVDMRQNTDQQIEDMRRAEAIASQNRAIQYKKVKLDYQKAVEWNSAKESPLAMNNSGTYKALVIWGDNFMKNVYVTINNDTASKFVNDGVEVFFVQSTKVTNFRCMGKTQKGNIVEIIFSDIFNQ